MNRTVVMMDQNKEEIVEKDPVCGMPVKVPLYYSRLDGSRYVFCCSTCKSEFDKNSGKYVASRRDSST